MQGNTHTTLGFADDAQSDVTRPAPSNRGVTRVTRIHLFILKCKLHILVTLIHFSHAGTGTA